MFYSVALVCRKKRQEGAEQSVLHLISRIT